MKALLQVIFLATFLAVSVQGYWWKFAKSDCGYDDVPGSCAGSTVDECKNICLNTTGCGGFNYPHGVLKKTDCLQNKKPQTTVDLYVIESSPMPLNVWPLPASIRSRNGSAMISENFKFTSDSTAKTLLNALSRYEKICFPHHLGAQGFVGFGSSVTALHVSVSSEDESHPQLETDESYTLEIPLDGIATLQAPTIYGALHGLETFSQLVSFDFDSSSYIMNGLPLHIDDSPRFPHRGLMIDTARHFQTLDAVRHIIDSLPYAKINVLHWHMVDSQSFPFESRSYPKLWEGAYSPQERYLQSDIAGIVEYARERGVRVMVEFDMPGHAASWCVGYPEVCPSTSCTQPLNPATEATFNLIAAVLAECTGNNSSVKPLFYDSFVHLGGDEVDTSCWTKSPAISKWLAQQNMTADGGYAYFVKRAAEIAIAQGKRPVQWVEVFDHFGSALDKRTIVHVWKDKSTLAKVVAAGYQALINNSPGSDSWYLDHLDIGVEAVYGNEPCADITDAKQCSLVLGGQGEMWGETVDSSDIESTVWPKLAAIAERLWSPREQVEKMTNQSAVLPRLHAFRCLLNQRGISAAPVNNAEARSAPPGPGSCLDQR